jgi:hypothetical protein
MHATSQNTQNPSNATRKSLESFWEYARELWRAETGAAAWSSFKKLIVALPSWALAAAIVALLALLTNAGFLFVPVAAAVLLVAIFFTVKRAVLNALREHDSQRDL